MPALWNIKIDYSVLESPFEISESFVLELMGRSRRPYYLEKTTTSRSFLAVFFALGDLFVQILSPKWAGLTLTAKRHSGHHNMCTVGP